MKQTQPFSIRPWPCPICLKYSTGCQKMANSKSKLLKRDGRTALSSRTRMMRKTTTRSPTPDKCLLLLGLWRNSRNCLSTCSLSATASNTTWMSPPRRTSNRWRRDTPSSSAPSSMFGLISTATRCSGPTPGRSTSFTSTYFRARRTLRWTTLKSTASTATTMRLWSNS